MSNLSPEQVKSAIQVFLTNEYNRKTEKEQKKLEKAIEDNDLEKVSELKEVLSKYKHRYSLEVWVDNAANKMAKQLSFGTHISKGIHSSSKGDNINFTPTSDLPKEIVGHQSVVEPRIDASGNAAALPLYSFFEFEVRDGEKIKDLLMKEDRALRLALSDDPEVSMQFFDVFHKMLTPALDKPKTSGHNKQLLWPMGNQEYTCIIPLYPSSLTNAVFTKVQYLKYSDEIVQKRKNRYSNKEDLAQESYPTINDLAVVKLGGNNPQTVSRHMSSQRGINYLLPSIPPVVSKHNEKFSLPRTATSIFSSELESKVTPALIDLYNVVRVKTNNMKVRDLRKRAVEEMLSKLFYYAEHIQSEYPAGWSQNYPNLDENEKFWLDPGRAELKGQEVWALKRKSTEWHKDVISSYAYWVNNLLKIKFKDIEEDFGVEEREQWEHDMRAMISLYERAGKGVFL